MIDHVDEISHRDPATIADNALKAAAKLWFVVAVIGQWIFVYYVAAFYGGLTVQDGLQGLKNSGMPGGYVTGDTVGNIAVGSHLFIAIIIIGLGPFQLIPQIRAHFPTFHRWNGRIFVVTAVTTSLAGLFLMWTRGTTGDLTQHLGTSLDGVLVIIFAAVAVRYAMARNIKVHRRWALRLFLAVNAVWFFRIGLMGWIVVNSGPVGFDSKTFTGPFLSFWAFGQYLLPLAVLELYLRTQDQAGTTGKFAMAGGLVVCTAATGVGIFAATMKLWLPRL